MAICISDTHGNLEKVKAFIAYKPEVEHIFIGDAFDSFSASDESIIETFKLLIKNCTYLVGNHEIPYLVNAHSYFKCSGNRPNPIFMHLIEMYKEWILGSAVRDNYLLVHGGLSKNHGRPFDTVEEASDWINSEWDWYKNNPVAPETLSSIFDIGSVRGGREQVSGPFWLTFNHEKYDYRFNQVVGHTCQTEPKINIVGKKDNTVKHVCIDSPKFICFNTETSEFENFIPDEFKDNDQMRRIMERNF